MDSVVAPVLQLKFGFMGCLLKANTLVLGNRSSLSPYLIILLFLRNALLQRDILANFYAMVLKAHFALLAFIVCTAHTSLHSSWTSVRTSQRSVRTSQISLPVRTSQTSVSNSQKSALLWYLSAHRFTRIVRASDSFVCCGSIRDLEKVKFSDNS